MNEIQRLERAKRQLDEVQRLAKLGSWEFDVRANRVIWTDGLYHIYGLTPDTFPATYDGYLERVHPDDRDRVSRTIQSALAQGGSFEFEERIIRPDGAVRTLLSVGRCIRDAETSEPLLLVGVCRDVTDEKRAVQDLARRERELEQAQEIAHVGSWVFDVDANDITWSAEMFRIFGIEPSALTYERYISCIHPDDVARVQHNVTHALGHGGSFSHEHRIVRADGSERIVLGHGEAERDATGRVIRLRGTAQDITERRAAEDRERHLAAEKAARAEAERAAQRMSFIADATTILASSLDYEETLRNVARLAVPDIVDWCAVDIVAEDDRLHRLAVEHVDPDRVRFAMELEERYPSDPDAPTGVHQVLRTGQPEWARVIPAELIERGAVDAEHLQLIQSLGLHSYAIMPLQVENQTIGAMTFVQAESGRELDEQDVALLENVSRRAAMAIHNARLVRELSDAHTRLQRQSDELEAQASELEEAMAELEMRNDELEQTMQEAERARAEAEHANAAKSQFLANMSHELRTPLNAIGGYAQLLALGVHGDISDAQRGAVERIRTNQRRLLALINDLLNFVKVRSGRIDITLSPEPVREILDGMVELVEPQIQERGLILSIAETRSDLFVHTNRERTEQVLLNLISNAIKFTAPGGTIEVRAEAADASVRIHVTDTGVGIPPDRLDDIFEPFVQLAQMPMRDNQGVGLGLAISRDLINSMGGSLTVESEEGKGSRFTVTLARADRASVVTETEITS